MGGSICPAQFKGIHNRQEDPRKCYKMAEKLGKREYTWQQERLQR